ncbi:hypothetical protein EVAR_66306_1 [Eumeta japonica]|uniref:Uncharacterized protein n=1 Tax=Eumeta variegata TaxID=151549 RepID=A0A4C1Z8V2_EUMVA|nr:hypothetical protein EVAR_66306_1 [Eumeta japonica]
MKARTKSGCEDELKVSSAAARPTRGSRLTKLDAIKPGGRLTKTPRPADRAPKHCSLLTDERFAFRHAPEVS